MRGRRAAASASQMLLIGLLVLPGPPSACSGSELLVDPGHPPLPPPASSGSDLLMDPSQDTVGGFMPVLAQVVSGSRGRVADGIYSCLDSAFKCVHVRKPLLRLEEEVGAIGQPNGEAHHKQRTIVDGSTTLYRSSPNVREGDATAEDWVWLNMATRPPRHAPSLNVVKIRDTGCLGPEDRPQRGRKGDNAPHKAAWDTQLGDVYAYARRLTDALSCYSSAATASTLSGQQRCRVDLAACTVAAKQAKKMRTSGPLSGEREEAACISSLLARAGEDCSAGDAATAHVTVGVFRLSEEWDTRGALDHFLAATTQHEDVSVEGDGEGEGEDGIMVQGDGFEWGAVWLAQAIRGQAHEASVGFTANSTAFGEAWAGTHLRSWRRHLGRKCSGIGMGDIIEGAERLILAGARGGEGRDGGENGHMDGSWRANSSALVDLHLALARTLILHGAFEEAGGHVRAAERLTMVEGIEWSADDEIRSDAASAVGVALHLEMALFSRTPVVLDSANSAITLRRELLAELERLGKSKDFLGSIPSPLEVGVRAQFLTTYQGLNDKATAIALAKTFDQASGKTLSYCSPHLHSASESSDREDLDKSGACCSAAAEQIPPGAPSSVAAEDGVGSQSSEIPDTDAHQEDAQAAAKEPMPDVNVNERNIRVGFLSSHFRWHSVGRLAVGLLEHLSRNAGLDIFVVDVSADGDSTKGQSSRLNGSDSIPGDKGGGDRKGGAPSASGDDVASNSIAARLAAAGASIVKLPLVNAEVSPSSGGAEATAAISVELKTGSKTGTGNHSLQRARQTIATLAVDVLVFGDVGMDALTTALAYGRLSPVQVAFWGHPGTTGLPTVDYFITSDIFEGKADLHTTRRRRDEITFSGGNNGGDFDCGSAEAKDGTTRSAADGPATARCGSSGDPASCSADQWEDRQGAFSEQLVRLDGLGIVFDDPIQTFHYNLDNDATATLRRRTFVGDEVSHDPPETKRTTIDTSVAGKAGGWVNGSSRVGGGSPPPGGEDSLAFAEETPNHPRLYVCAQSLMKMHPAFDAVLAGILTADPFAHIVLLRDSRQLLWHSRFRRRLRAAVDDAEGRAIAAQVANDTAITTVGSEPRCPSSAPSSDDNPKTSTPSSCPAPPRPATCVGTNEFPQRGRSDTAAAVGSGGTAGSNLGRNHARKKEEHHHHHPQQQTRTAAMGSFWNRVRFVSPLSGHDFFRLQCRADVVLDPFPFGGGVTILEALACGTPVVTAGELQSVHRLAEGMIIAAAGAAAARDTADHAEGEAADAGTPVTSTSGAATSSTAAAAVGATTAALEGGGEATGDGHPTKHHSSSEKSRPRIRGRGFDRREEGVGRRAGAGAGKEVDAVPSSDDACSLVDRLVATTTGEYVTKAVALTAPGQLRECIVRTLERGRDGMLQGDGGVARDWERFLRIAAASPLAAAKAEVFPAQASVG